MKRNGLVGLQVPFVLILASSWALGDITGSKHDFSGASWNASGEICIVCHTPHNAKSSSGGAPLWNHDLTTSTFTLYSSPTLKQTPLQPQGVTKLCLSCHDGTVALDSYGGNTGSTFITGKANFGTDLSTHHPVSILWKHQTLGSGSAQCSNCHFGNEDLLPFFGVKNAMYMECATCHDVHDGTPSFTFMLRMTLAGSQLCLHCHGK